jgi:hypothetical protein
MAVKTPASPEIGRLNISHVVAGGESALMRPVHSPPRNSNRRYAEEPAATGSQVLALH